MNQPQSFNHNNECKKNTYIMIGFARFLPGTRVCGTLHHHDHNVGPPYGRVSWSSGSSQIKQTARDLTGRESPSIKATRSPAGIPLPIIIASKLIFIFDKKTRSEGNRRNRSLCLLFWIVASVAAMGQIKCGGRKNTFHFGKVKSAPRVDQLLSW